MKLFVFSWKDPNLLCRKKKRIERERGREGGRDINKTKQKGENIIYPEEYVALAPTIYTTQTVNNIYVKCERTNKLLPLPLLWFRVGGYRRRCPVDKRIMYKRDTSAKQPRVNLRNRFSYIFSSGSCFSRF